MPKRVRHDESTMPVFIFLITLSILVFVHEFGHFLAAKKSGVKVEEFGFGIPPRIFGRKIGETLYSINLLPIGGFVKLKGEEADEVLGFGGEGSFSSVSKKKKLVIVIAGVVGNLILSYFLFVLLFLVGYPTASGQVKVDEVLKESPAAVSGFAVGDVLLNFNGQKIEDPNQFVKIVKKTSGQASIFTIERQAKILNLKSTPLINPPSGQGALGIRLGYESQITYPRLGLGDSFVSGFRETGKYLSLMVKGIKNLVTELFKGHSPQELAGVVGIYKISTQALEIGWQVYLQFVALISLNLFLFNLLPVPALDGGRVLFILIELFTRRKISAKIERLVNNTGFALLITLFVLITIRDIKRF